MGTHTQRAPTALKVKKDTRVYTMTLRKRLRSIDPSLTGEERLAKRSAIISQWLNDSDPSDDSSDGSSDDESSICSSDSDDMTNYVLNIPREIRNFIYDYVWGSRPYWLVLHEAMVFIVYYGGSQDERRARQAQDFLENGSGHYERVKRLGWLDMKWIVACRTFHQEAMTQLYT